MSASSATTGWWYACPQRGRKITPWSHDRFLAATTSNMAANPYEILFGLALRPLLFHGTCNGEAFTLQVERQDSLQPSSTGVRGPISWS